MSDIAEIEEFLRRYGSDYKELLQRVTASCRAVQKSLGAGMVDDVYTRGDSQGGEELKDAGKIVGKVRRRSLKPGAAAFLELNDVVGLTVVVQYPDQVAAVIGAVRGNLRGRKIKTSRPERHENKNGYYATHVVCEGVQGAEVLKCEIQFKTMLHDAWASKMHDLTYKPAGLLDPRLRALMASIASTIENLEQQSRLIRDMIKASWNVEHEARQAARDQLFRLMLSYGAEVWRASGDDAIVALHDRIEASEQLIRSVPTDDARLRRILTEVEACCRDEGRLRHAWIMAGRVASLRTGPDLVRFFQRQADAWLRLAPTGLADDVLPKEIAAVPLMFYVIGDLDRAIDYTDRLLQNPEYAALPPSERLHVEFNRATFLIEREYHQPTSDPADRAKLWEEVQAFLGSKALRSREDLSSSALDTLGLAKITFACTKAEVRAGIEDCVEAMSLSPDTEKDLSLAYMDLNLRLGWRRYFELEIRLAGAEL